MGENVGKKLGDKVGEKTVEKVGESLGEIHKLNLCHITWATFWGTATRPTYPLEALYKEEG